MGKTKLPSFEMITAECRLIDCEDCKQQPTVGLYLSLATNQEYQFTVNSEYVVTATTALEKNKLDEVSGKIRKDFPGLRFFTESRDTQTLLSIPGINLPENSACLSEGFIKTGIMKTS